MKDSEGKASPFVWVPMAVVVVLFWVYWIAKFLEAT